MNYEHNRRSVCLACLFGLFPVTWAALVTAPHFSQGLFSIITGFSKAFVNPFQIVWVTDTPKCLLIFYVGYAIGIGVYLSTRRNYRHREEHGSAKWGDVKAICKKYKDPDNEQNILLTQNVCIGLDGRKHQRNLNILCCGGSGSGKTRFFCKPGLMSANTSYVVLDPKGELVRDVGNLLKQQGYTIKVFDLVNIARSHCYNPFAYLQDDKDVLKLVTNLIRNTTPKGANSNDPFWEKSETALLEALILYLLSEAPSDEQNFGMVMELLAAAEVREEDETYQSPLDILFERLAMRDPDNLAVKQYGIYKLAAGRTAKSILVSLGVRLEKFNLPSVAGLTMVDELDLPSLGEKKTALFCVIPDNDSSLNFLVGMIYTQLFQQLYYLADYKYNGRLPIHVRFLMDEFPNISIPDDFPKILATCRSRSISLNMVIQNIAQLKALFEKEWQSVVGNADTFLYLGGGNEPDSNEMVSKMLGKETIDLNTYGQSHGHNGNYSTNWQITGRELLTPDEIRTMDNRYALLFIRGESPIMDKKYDLLKHPNIKFTVDGGAPPYQHGSTPHALDWRTVVLNQNSDYELLAEDELEALFSTQKEGSIYEAV